mgnify:CR=1 FL=1
MGAAIAGVASVLSLKGSPSHRIYPEIGMNLQVHWQYAQDDDQVDEIGWPSDAVSAVVIGVPHNAEKPELDWYDGKGTPGNRILIQINKDLSRWIEKTYSIKTYTLPYFVEKGGIFLKDAAVMAGLGCIGKNNLLVTPEYGPRIRFRALLLDYEAETTGPIVFNPCEGCDQPCRKACPVQAFEKPIYPVDALGQSSLPGTDGTYDRVTCNTKMEQDIEQAVAMKPASAEKHQEMKRAIGKFEEDGIGKTKGDKEDHCIVRFCRECELVCPIGGN